MRKILLILLVIILATPAYSQDDDSTPYMPYAEQPKQSTTTKKTTKKAPAKKTTTKKKTTKKAPAKKSTKPAAPRVTSLQQGIDLLKQDRYEAAKQYLLKAIQENRNDPNVWYWYGVYHEKTGGYYQAQYFYSKAVTIDPAFEPLSRVVYYPNDPEKTPLWDPKRPARVYPVETSSNGVTISSSNNYPSSPYDPILPKVPVYTPPEPDASPYDGDPWAPGVYVPPTPVEASAENRRYTVEIPVSSTAVVTRETVVTERDEVRADLPLYEPPDPSVKVAAAPTTTEAKATVKPASSTTTKAPAVPRKIVKASDKKKSTSKSTTTKSTSTKAKPAAPKTPASSDVKPSTSTTTRRHETPMPIVPETRAEEHEPEKHTTEYLPPVGQFVPDPGTVPETMIPPVGQTGN